MLSDRTKEMVNLEQCPLFSYSCFRARSRAANQIRPGMVERKLSPCTTYWPFDGTTKGKYAFPAVVLGNRLFFSRKTMLQSWETISLRLS
jgi:hypothetical protein